MSNLVTVLPHAWRRHIAQKIAVPWKGEEEEKGAGQHTAKSAMSLAVFYNIFT